MISESTTPKYLFEYESICTKKVILHKEEIIIHDLNYGNIISHFPNQNQLSVKRDI